MDDIEVSAKAKPFKNGWWCDVIKLNIVSEKKAGEYNLHQDKPPKLCYGCNRVWQYTPVANNSLAPTEFLKDFPKRGCKIKKCLYCD